MKIRIKKSFQNAEQAERGLLIYLAENAQDVGLISVVLDQTDLTSSSVHQRIFTAIQELRIDARGDSTGDVQEILVSRGDQEAAAYLSSHLTTAERPRSWAEALALAGHLVLLATMQRAIEGDPAPTDDVLW